MNSINIDEKIIKENWKFLFNQQFMGFFNKLVEEFYPKWQEVLEHRREFKKKIDEGYQLDFLPETKKIREGDWKVGEIPRELQDRKVEITGPVDRKMVINGLNSGARVYMADLEDSQSPTWNGLIEGQVNLYDAVRRQITYQSPEGKSYSLNDETAVLIVRPRGLHLPEKHITYQDNPVPGFLLDFALYFFHNAQERINQGTLPFFYIPKLEHYQDARLWSEVFAWSENYLNLDKGSIKVTVLIETITAVFEMQEIIHELKDYIVGLNCGRWDYIFSFIKTFARMPEFVLPNREAVGMGVHFLNSYSLELIRTCHRRGIFAMGGMAAQIPIKNDDQANQTSLNKVRVDKERELENGHDGTWVAHPGLVSMVLEIFNSKLSGLNQLDKQIEEHITADDLLQVPEGEITETGFINNCRASLHYLAAWIGGNGCVPLNNLMEDLATAEISRSQLWQWIYHKQKLADGRSIDQSLYESTMDKLMSEIQEKQVPLVASQDEYQKARKVVDQLVINDQFIEFSSLPAYEFLG